MTIRVLSNSRGFTLIEVLLSSAIGLSLMASFVWIYLDFQKRAQDRARVIEDVEAVENLRNRLRPIVDCSVILKDVQRVKAGKTFDFDSSNLPAALRTEGVQTAQFIRLDSVKNMGTLLFKLKSGRQMRLPVASQFDSKENLKKCSTLLIDESQELACPNEQL